jgi:signal transduction histidine kinase/DNA-binding response OmpR family regulator
MPGERILIVEDDPAVLDLCTRILLDGGYRVSRATTPGRSLEIAQLQRHDLVLTDLGAINLDGLNTVHDIKRLDPTVVGVAMTPRDSLDTGLNALRLGMDDLVIKPFSEEELRQVVSSALEKGRFQRENIRLKALIPLYELSKAFMGTTQLDALLTEIVEVSSKESGSDRASLMLWDEDLQAMTIRAAIGLPEDVVRSTVVKLGEGISGRVAQDRQALVLDSTSPSDADLRGLMKLDQISSAICVPLTVRDELVGVLSLSKMGENESPFTAGSLELASVLAGQAAIAIKNARLFEQIQNAYEELKRLDELKSEFINLASHELRTPLAILLGYAYLLEEQATESTRQYARAIIESAMRLKQLITDMLNLRHLEEGEMDLDLKRVDMADVVQAVLDDLGFLANEKGQSLAVDLPSDLPQLRADEGKLHLILANLVSNAIKFTPQKGAIYIAASDGQDELTVSVKDSGPGIDPAEFHRLFDRFYQVGGSLRREYPGLGLGLSIAKELVQLHNGELWVESELGKGSTFFFTISRHLTPPS